MSIHSWEAICFVIFIALIFKPTKKFFVQYLNQYSISISKNIEDATRLKNEAQESVNYYSQKHEEFTQIIKEINDNTQYNIKKLKETAEKNLENRINQKMRIHEETIEIHKKEQLSRMRIDTFRKALWIAKQYLRDHNDTSLSKEDIEDTLTTTKNNLTSTDLE